VTFAQRVMDCGDAGHILVSEDTARLFFQVGNWVNRLHDIGKTKVKHGVRLHLFSLYVSEVGNPELPRKLRRERVRRATAAGGIILGGALLIVVALLKLIISPAPPPVQTQITTNPDARPVHTGAISPNGGALAYVHQGGIFVRDIASGEERKLPVAGGEEFSFASPNWALAWFPDSNRLLVTGPTGNEKFESLWRFSLTGEPRKLRDRAWLPAVAADGSRIAYIDAETERSIWVMESEGREPRTAYTAPEGHLISDIAWSPTNTQLAFVEETGGPDKDLLRTVDVGTGEITQLIAGVHLTSGPAGEFSGLCWLPDGRILFVRPSSPGSRGSELWAVPVDARSGKATGHAALVTSNPGVYWSDLSSTSDGRIVAFLKTKLRYSIFLGTLHPDHGAPGQLEAFLSEESKNWASSWTRDARYVLLTSDRKRGVEDIYRQGVDGGSPEPLALGDEAKSGAVEISDGTSILYWSWPKEGGDYPKEKKLQVLPKGQSSPRTLLQKAGTAELRCSMARPICVVSEEAESSLRFSRLDVRQPSTEFLVAVPLRIADGYDWDLSPDGGQIAVVHSDVGDSEIRIVNLSNGTVSKQPVHPWASFEGIAWAPDGKGLYVSSNMPKQASLLHVDMSGNARVLWRSGLESFQPPLPSPDGKRLAVSISSTGESNAWLMEQF